VLRTILIFCLIFVVTACAEEQHRERASLRAGVLPDKSAELLRDEFQPLIDYLAIQTGKDIELVVPETYEHLLALFASGEVDLAFFGGLTFLQAQATSGAVPLVTRDVDARFTSVFFAQNNDAGTKISDFGGRNFGFGSNLSTSGHLMPRYYLQTLGLAPEKFFASVSYTGAHDKTGWAVADGTLDLGVANSLVIKRMLESGALDKDKVKIIWETPPYTDYVWAIHGDFSSSLRENLQEAFLQLSMVDDYGRAILEKQGAKSFLPVRHEDFMKLRELAAEMGLL